MNTYKMDDAFILHSLDVYRIIARPKGKAISECVQGWMPNF